MPETALLSASRMDGDSEFYNSSVKHLFWGNLNVVRNVFTLRSVFGEYHLLPGHRLLSLLADWSRSFLVFSFTFLVAVARILIKPGPS